MIRLERFWGGPMRSVHGNLTGQRKFGWRLFLGPVVLHFEAWENPSRWMKRTSNQDRDPASKPEGSRCPDGNATCDGSDLLHGDWCKGEAQLIRYRCLNGHSFGGKTDSRGVYNATVICPECGSTAMRETSNQERQPE